jgi:hypothetical protein
MTILLDSLRYCIQLVCQTKLISVFINEETFRFVALLVLTETEVSRPFLVKFSNKTHKITNFNFLARNTSVSIALIAFEEDFL